MLTAAAQDAMEAATRKETWPGRDAGRIPISWHTMDDEEATAVYDLMLSGQSLVGGPALEAFEKAFAAKVGASYAIATTSCSAALHAAYLAADVDGREVITTPLTFAATANMAVHAGASVRFADIDPWWLTLAPETLFRELNPKVRAIVPVHFGGLAADILGIEREAAKVGAIVIEDAAHAVGGLYQDGTPIGSRRDNLCCFSFNVQKNMTTIEGGMVTTGDPQLAAAVRQIVNQGMESQGPWRNNARLGLKGRMTDLNATIGLIQLRKLDDMNARRRGIAEYYREALADVDGIDLPPWPAEASVWHLFPLRVNKRLAVMQGLWDAHIEATVHYKALNLHSYWRSRSDNADRGRNGFSEVASEDLLSLPCFPGLSEEEMDRVVDAVRRFA